MFKHTVSLTSFMSYFVSCLVLLVLLWQKLSSEKCVRIRLLASCATGQPVHDTQPQRRFHNIHFDITHIRHTNEDKHEHSKLSTQSAVSPTQDWDWVVFLKNYFADDDFIINKTKFWSFWTKYMRHTSNNSVWKVGTIHF